MLDPFVDTTQKELREAWERIEELEKENKILQGEISAARDYIKWCDDTISVLIKERNGLEEQIKALEDIQEEELDQKQREWNFEEHDEEDGWDGWENPLVIGDRHEMGG